MNLNGYTREELVDCVDRELRMRERVYRTRVSMAKMTRAFADQEIAKMRAVLEVVRALPVVPPPQRSLFGVSK